MKKMLLGITLLFSVAGMLGAQEKPPATGSPQKAAAVTAQPAPAAIKVTEDFVIGVDDTLRVDVWKDPESSAPQVVVRPDGKITVPLIKDVQAAGLTPKQLEESIAQKLTAFLKDPPTVTVIVLKIESRKVSIVGNVGRQGDFPLSGPMTVMELIAKAGGITENAKGGGKAIKVLRKKDGSLLDFNYREVIEGRNLKQNVLLENGDMVLVR